MHGQTTISYRDVIDGGDSEFDEDLVVSKPLVPGAIYEWDLLLAYSAAMFTGMDFGESYAAFFSYPRVDYGSSNGAYVFTTEP